MGVGWIDLSDFTQRKRRERGFTPDHPILKQTGALKRAVLLPFTTSSPMVGAASFDGVSVGWHAIDGDMSFRIDGEKVTNNDGGISFLEGTKNIVIGVVPQRRFYYIDSRAIDGAATHAVHSIVRRGFGLSGDTFFAGSDQILKR